MTQGSSKETNHGPCTVLTMHQDLLCHVYDTSQDKYYLTVHDMFMTWFLYVSLMILGSRNIWCLMIQRSSNAKTKTETNHWMVMTTHLHLPWHVYEKITSVRFKARSFQSDDSRVRVRSGHRCISGQFMMPTVTRLWVMTVLRGKVQVVLFLLFLKWPLCRS